MAVASFEFSEVHKILVHWRWIAGFGIFLLAVGICALVETPQATAAATLVLGWLLLIGGIIECIRGFELSLWGGLFWHLFGGILGIIAGVLLITNILAGALAVTLVLALTLIASGVFRIVAALGSRLFRSNWTVLEGAITIFMGSLVLAQWPFSGIWFLGTALGIAFIMRGWAYLTFALAIRQLGSARKKQLLAA
jgi:uncharacterized membrane protein HdeD (DUF308 family)